MKKSAAAIAAVLMAATASGCSATGKTAVQVGALDSAAPTAEAELTRVYFDTLECEVKAGETAAVQATVTGGAVSYRTISPAIATVTADGTHLSVRGIKAGTTYLLAMDADGCEHNACRIVVTGKTEGETPDPPGPGPVDPDPVGPEEPDKESNRNMVYDTYDLDTYLYPYWRGNTVYNETALMIGETDATPLLYPATRILQVASYDHATVYEEGKDYTYDAQNNLLRRTANSRMPFWKRDEWYMTAAQSEKFPTNRFLAANMTDYVYFAEGSVISEKQISISYEHAPVAENDWQVVPSRANDFARLRTKLSNKQNVQILYYGDSVVTGANSSGVVGCGLRAPAYTTMISDFIRSKFGVTVTDQNQAWGGTHAGQALANFPQYQTALYTSGANFGQPYRGAATTVTPDLIVIGFGLNDQNAAPYATATDASGNYTHEKFVQNIDTLVHKARQAWANTDILIVAPTIGNPETAPYTVYRNGEQEAALMQWYTNTARQYGGVAVAQVTTMYRQLYAKKGNRYADFTGNNVNHPNDTGARMIAQVCLHTLFGDEYFK